MSNLSGKHSSFAAGSLRLDVISGYVLAFSRVAAWAGVSAYVYRQLGAEAFGILALLRGTITLLTYTSLGIGPAMVRALAGVQRVPVAMPVASVIPTAAGDEVAAAAPGTNPSVLQYATERVDETCTPEQRVFHSGMGLMIRLFLLAVVVTAALTAGLYYLDVFHLHARESTSLVALLFGLGVAVRIIGEPLSAVLQVRGRLWIDHAILSGGELLWLALVVGSAAGSIELVAGLWLASSIAVTLGRYLFSLPLIADLRSRSRCSDKKIIASLLAFGGTITLAQTADFLYAPTDYLIIAWLLDAASVAAYAPAVQIDAALLLCVAGISVALFPRAAHASAGDDLAQLRRLYIRGTLVSLGLLIAAAAVMLALSGVLLRLWLGTPPAQTFAILPLVLIHSVVGGSSGVGRAVLLGMGRASAFTASVLLAGLANVFLSVLFVGVFQWGLKGIVLATIIVVVARCAIWMPWYVLRATKERDQTANRPS